LFNAIASSKHPKIQLVLKNMFIWSQSFKKWLIFEHFQKRIISRNAKEGIKEVE